jgi:hypothetical protein
MAAESGRPSNKSRGSIESGSLPIECAIGSDPGELDEKVSIFFDRALDLFPKAIILVPIRLRYKVVDFNRFFL